MHGSFNSLITIIEVKHIKNPFIKNKYNAPKKNFNWRVARPYPAVQSGGINAVAIATPGITLPFSFLVKPIIPAKPPQIAIKTSHIVGLILARSSEWAVDIGEIVKYRAEVTIHIVTWNVSLKAASFAKDKSSVAIP